jgi:hypothetical protein
LDSVIDGAARLHIRRHDQAVREMVRVARSAVFLLDVNNYGQGTLAKRVAKQALHVLGLWPAAVFLRTRGKGYCFSEGDGVFYSYSVFDSISLIRKKFPTIHYLNVDPVRSSFLYHDARGLAILARKPTGSEIR